MTVETVEGEEHSKTVELEAGNDHHTAAIEEQHLMAKQQRVEEIPPPLR